MSEFTLAQEYNQQGVVLYSQDKYEDALAYFEKAIADDPRYIESYINSAQAYIMMDQYDNAMKCLDKALLVDKKNGLVYFHMGNVELLQSNGEAAREAYNKAISLGYDNIQIYINLAADAEERGDMEEAIRYYNNIIALDKFNGYAKARKAQVLLALKRLPEALKTCDSLIETNPNLFEGYHYKFAILSDMGKYAEAEAVLDRGLELFPDDEGFYYDKARLCHAQNRLEEALDILNNKVPVNDDNRSSLVAFKAELLLAQEKTAEAEEILLAEYPQSTDGEVAFLLTSIYMAKQEYEAVLSYAQAVLDSGEIDNYYHAALYYHAVAQSKLGRKQEADTEFENAAKFYRAACSRNPGQLQLYFYRAMCYSELKQHDKALAMTDYILNVDGNIMEARMIRMKACKALGKEAEAQVERSIIEAKKPALLSAVED